MPREHGLSPAELLLHRKPRSHFPELVEEVILEKVCDALDKREEKEAEMIKKLDEEVANKSILSWQIVQETEMLEWKKLQYHLQ